MNVNMSCAFESIWYEIEQKQMTQITDKKIIHILDPGLLLLLCCGTTAL